MSSMEIILGEPSRLERLATDIHNHYVASCAGDPDRKMCIRDRKRGVTLLLITEKRLITSETVKQEFLV